jgi:phage terminase small subunit
MAGKGAPKKKSARHVGAKPTKGYKARTERSLKSSGNPEREETPERKAWRAAYLKTKKAERYEEMSKFADSLEEIELATQVAARNRLERLVQLRDTLAQKMDDTQMLAVTEYLNEGTTKRASMLMNGYAAVTARHTTSFRNPNVKKYLAITRKINEITTGVTAEFVLQEFTKLAKVSAQDLYDKDGNIIPPHELPPDVAAAISEIKERSWIEGKGAAAKKITEVTYRLHNKLAALDALGKHTGIYEADNKQKASNVKMQFILPTNGRNTDLIIDHDVEIVESKTLK